MKTVKHKKHCLLQCRIIVLKMYMSLFTKLNNMLFNNRQAEYKTFVCNRTSMIYTS